MPSNTALAGLQQHKMTQWCTLATALSVYTMALLYWLCEGTTKMVYVMERSVR